MENESPQEEPLKDKSLKKARNKNNKQATVLKQLNNQNLYPLQERIGIYVVAALSALGLVLITYTGVMALVSNAEDGVYDTPVDVDVDVDEVTDMLDDLDDLLDYDDDSEELEQDDAAPHEYTESDDEVESGDENDDDEAEDSSDEVTTGVINDNMVSLWREAGSGDAMLALQEGYVVTILELNYNAYWSHVEVETDAIDGISTLRGYIETEFIDIEE